MHQKIFLVLLNFGSLSAQFEITIEVFFIPDPVFFYNLPTILVMAIIGTLANFVLVGGLLFIVTEIGALGSILQTNSITDLDNMVPHNLSLLEILLFASLITAVDPVAVLAIFQEVGVNPDLYFLVFGESLFNGMIYRKKYYSFFLN